MYKKIITSCIMAILLIGCTNTNQTHIDTPSPSITQDKGKSIALQGFRLLETKEFKDAKEKLELATKLGHVDAPRALALMYINSDGVNKDYTKAMQYLQKAYKRGNHVAAYDIGAMYKNGEGVKPNLNLAKKYYLIAAKKEYGLAQFELAKIFAYQRNKKQFMYWGKKAQAHGYTFKKIKTNSQKGY